MPFNDDYLKNEFYFFVKLTGPFFDFPQEDSVDAYVVLGL